MKEEVTKKEILELEREYAKAFSDWREGDTLVSYFERQRLHSMSEAFKKDYERLGIPPFHLLDKHSEETPE